MAIDTTKTTSHRYWYSVVIPSIGISASGWCFGADAFAAANNAITDIARTKSNAKFLTANDITVTHDGACSCIPSELRSW